MVNEQSPRSDWYRKKNHVPNGPNAADHTYPVKTNRTGRVIGHVMSMIDRKVMPFHSSLERAFILVMSLDPRCVALLAQPPSIDYSTDAGLRSYTPDFRVKFETGQKLLVETKPDWDFRREENAVKWPRIQEAAGKLGFGFVWMNDDKLFHQPRWDNVTLLQLYRANEIDVDLANLIDRAFGRQPVIALKDLQRLSNDALLVRDTVWALIVHRYLWTDLNRPLNEESLIQKVTRPFIDRTRISQ